MKSAALFFAPGRWLHPLCRAKPLTGQGLLEVSGEGFFGFFLIKDHLGMWSSTQLDIERQVRVCSRPAQVLTPLLSTGRRPRGR